MYVIKYFLCFNIQCLSQEQGTLSTEHKNVRSICVLFMQIC